MEGTWDFNYTGTQSLKPLYPINNNLRYFHWILIGWYHTRKCPNFSTNIFKTNFQVQGEQGIRAADGESCDGRGFAEHARKLSGTMFGIL